MEALAAGAADAALVRQLRDFVLWAGDGRKLTQTGRLRLADARELVPLLRTGDDLDPRIGSRVFRTTTSDDLPELTRIVELALALRLVRKVHGWLRPVQKNAALLARPLDLWLTTYQALPDVADIVLDRPWRQSPVQIHFAEVVDELLAAMYADGAIPVPDAYELAWLVSTSRYHIRFAPEQVQRETREIVDRDVRETLNALQSLGAVDVTGGGVELTPLARFGFRRRMGEAEPGDRVYQLTVTLRESDPRVWRRLVVSARQRLDRLSLVLQAALGWTNSHLHAFDDGTAQYVIADADDELGHLDEREFTLEHLVSRSGGTFSFWYDFGDNWWHDIVIEDSVVAEAGVRYARCVDGGSKCPPEDVGGIGGYAEFREVLDDPSHDEHEHYVMWAGLKSAADWDPYHFDVAETNRALGLVGSGYPRLGGRRQRDQQDDQREAREQ